MLHGKRLSDRPAGKLAHPSGRDASDGGSCSKVCVYPALLISKARVRVRVPKHTYLQSELSTITQMDSLQHTDAVRGAVFRSCRYASAISSQCLNASVSDAGALDKPDTLKLGKIGQLSYARVGEVAATSKIDISNAIARLGKSDYGCVGNAGAVAEVNVV